MSSLVDYSTVQNTNSQEVTQMSFDWLKKQMEGAGEGEEKVNLPGDGDFQRGIAGLWKQAPMFRMYFENGLDPKEFGISFTSKIPTRSGGGAFFYWNHTAEMTKFATEAAKLKEWKSAPRVWRWETPSANILNWSGDEDPITTFGETFAIDIDLVGLGSKRRTALHLLFLPSLVQSIAIASGAFDNEIYAYENLATRGEDVTEEYCTRLVGPAEGQDVDYEAGELWQARTEIWAALGETNPKAWTTGQGGSTDTTSEKLALPLAILSTPKISIASMISRVATPRMPTPHEAANTDNPYPFPMNIVTKSWTSKEEAVKELGGDSDMPPVPAEWASSSTPVQFRAWVVKWLSDNYADKTKAQVLNSVRQKDLSEIAMSSEELIPWVSLVMDK